MATGKLFLFFSARTTGEMAMQLVVDSLCSDYILFCCLLYCLVKDQCLVICLSTGNHHGIIYPIDKLSKADFKQAKIINVRHICAKAFHIKVCGTKL